MTKYRTDTGQEVNGDKWHPEWLVPLTDQIRGEIKRQRALLKIAHVKWSEVLPETLDKVLALLASDPGFDWEGPKREEP